MKKISGVIAPDMLPEKISGRTTLVGSVSHNAQQLPNCIREALCGMGAYKTAITLDLLLIMGFKGGQWLSYNDVLEACAPYTAIHILRTGLQHFTIARRKMSRGTPGRPAYEYRLPYLEQLKRQLVSDYSYVTDTLLLADFRNGKSYKMALHRELIQRESDLNAGDGATFSRDFLCARIGVSASTCRRYEKELGIYVEARHREYTIDSKARLIIVPECREHNGYHLEITTRKGMIKRFPAVRAIAGHYRKLGYDVYLKKRVTNRYHPTTPNWMPSPDESENLKSAILDFFN